MIEAPTSIQIARAMERAHMERAKAFSTFWSTLLKLPTRRNRALSSRWA